MSKFNTFIAHSQLDFKQHQLEGVQWCVNNETREDPPCGVRGGFIADEMGLGKTIVVIGLIYVNFMARTLIVLPPALVHQWYLQIYKTTGHKSTVFHGTNKKNITLEQLKSSKIVITTYSALHPNHKKNKHVYEEPRKQSLLHQLVWSRIVFDEAHHLRNKKSTCHQWAKLLKTNIRWLVSGTPVQNKKQDFYNLCSVIGLPASYYTDCVNIETIKISFVLKRTKQQANIVLPTLTVENTTTPWKNKKEHELSQEIHSKFKFTCMRKTIKQRLEQDSQLSLILKARQMCILPSLLKTHDEYYTEAYKQTSKIDNVVDSILKKKDNGNGKIVFCHFRGEIDLIQQRLIDGGIEKVATFDGRVSGKKRNQILTEKNNVLILQIQTGCEGLNLQHNYNEIYFVSPHWNPAIEDQAIARCHRIGQTKPVFVERFEMDKFYEETDEELPLPISIDNHVTNVQNSKRFMASQIF